MDIEEIIEEICEAYDSEHDIDYGYSDSSSNAFCQDRGFRARLRVLLEDWEAEIREQEIAEAAA